MSKSQHFSMIIFIVCILLLVNNIAMSEEIQTTNSKITVHAQRVAKVKSNKKFSTQTSPTELIKEKDQKVRLIVQIKPSPLDKRIASKANQSRKSVRERTRKKLQDFSNKLDSSKVKVRKEFSYIHAFSADVNLEGIEELLNDENVIGVFEDRKRIPAISQGLELIKGEVGRQEFGGSGVSIAILDTGIDYSHPMLGGGGFPNSKVIGGTDTGEDDNDPMDADGHGTAVAGIAAGELPLVGYGDYAGGIAPEAKLYALKITASDGFAYDSDIIDAIEWCITHQFDAPDNPIKIINISFAGDQYFDHCDNYDSYTQIFAQTIDNAVQAGITIFVSSGNDGYTNAVGLPACFSGVVSVGEVYDADIGSSGPYSIGAYGTQECTDTSTYEDLVTCYSNSSSTLDLLAPGKAAYTTDIVGSDGYSTGNYEPFFGGTSASSPYAAGAAALIQASSKIYRGDFYSPLELKNIMLAAGDSIIDSKNSIATPRININNMYQMLIHWGDINLDGQTTLQDSILGLQLLSGYDMSAPVSILGTVEQNDRIGLEEVLYSLQVEADICMSIQPEFCTTLVACEDAGGDWGDGGCHFLDQIECESLQWYWYYNRCNQEPGCGSANLEACDRQAACEDADGFWHENSCIQDPTIETESNDSKATADSIIFDTPVTGLITSSTDDDWFVFSTDIPRTVTVSLAGSEGYNYWKVGVYDSNDTLIAQLSHIGSNDSFNLSLPDAGYYYVTVSGDLSSAYRYQYQVTVLSNDGVQVTPTETESNDSKATADAIVFDAPITGTIPSDTDEDWFVFSNDIARTITVSLAGSGTSSEAWKVGVYNSSDILIAQLSDLGRNDSFNVSLPDAGDYYVTVSFDSPNYHYYYQLTVISNDGAQITPTETESNDFKATADPIVFDTPITGTVSTSVDEDWFVFSNDTARTITVTLAGSRTDSGVWKVGVYNSSDILMAQLSYMGSNDSFNVSLPDVGDYYVVVLGDNLHDAYRYQYQVTVFSNDGQQITPTETELNDSKATADSIVFDAPITGTVSTSADEDWFVFSTDIPRTVTVSLSSSESIISLWKVGIYNSSDTLIAQLSHMGSGSNDSFNLSLTDAGDYYVVISGYSGYAYRCQYQVSVLSNDGVLITPTETESNDSKATADAIVFDAPITGTIPSDTDEDWFVFSNDNARTITVRFAGGGSSNGYWKLGVYDSSDTLMAYFPGMGSNDSLNVSLPDAGNYYVAVSVDGPYGESYQYEVTVLSNEGQQITPTETESNNFRTTADVIVFDKPITGTIPSDADEDWFVFSNDSARTVTVSLAGIGSSYGYLKIGVYDSTDTLIAQLPRMANNDSFNISLLDADDYYVIVSANNLKGYQYELTVLANDGVQTTPTETEPNDSVDTADPIVFDTSVTGIITSDADEDWFVFSNDSARTVTVSLAGSGTSNRVWRVKVYDSSYSLIAEQSGMGSYDSFNVSLLNAGDYYIIVSDGPPRYAYSYEYQLTVLNL